MTAVTEPKKASKKKDADVVDDVADVDLADESPEVPPAKPGEPGFDWADEYPGEKFMVYTANDGRTVGLASSKGRIKPGDFRRMTHMQDWQATFYMIEKIACPAALAVSDDFDDDEYSKMMTSWTEWANTSVGES